MATVESEVQCWKPGVLSAWRLLWAIVVGLVFATTASAQTETKVITPTLADWVYRKPPNDVPLRVGIVPAEALVPPVTSEITKAFSVCNRVWLDQGGSYERPFAVTYVSDNQVSSKAVFQGIFALDGYILNTRNNWDRLEPVEGYGRGGRGVFNPRVEAVLLVDYDHEPSRENRYFSLYLKRVKELPCDGLKKSECKRFEAEAELYEFERKVYFPDFLRKAELGKVHIDSRCVGQQYLYHKEPFLEKTSWSERFLNILRND
jgi:hypothetical protein